MDFALVFARMFPGENVSPATSSGTYEQIVATWRGSQSCPTLAECEAVWATIQAELAGEETRLAGLDNTLGTATVGPITPRTIAQLKAMTWAEYSAWFDTNFTTAASLIALLKRLLLYVIRKV